MRDAVVDTSALQYLFQIDQLDLLCRLYRRVVVPIAVREEIVAGLARGIPLPDLGRFSWLETRAVSDAALLTLAADLGAGEREVLALATKIPDAVAILDDGLARRYARLLGVRYTGTLGVLLRAKQAGYFADVRPLVDRLHHLGFHLDPQTRAAVLCLANETDEPSAS